MVKFRIDKSESLQGGKLSVRGIYRMRLDMLRADMSKAGNYMATWKATVEDGPEKGRVCYGQLMYADATGQPYAWAGRVWMEFLEGIGYTREDAGDILDSGCEWDEIEAWGSDHVVGQSGWLEFTPPIGEGSFAETEWLRESEAESRKAIAAEAAAARASLDADVPF